MQGPKDIRIEPYTKQLACQMSSSKAADSNLTNMEEAVLQNKELEHHIAPTNFKQSRFILRPVPNLNHLMIYEDNCQRWLHDPQASRNSNFRLSTKTEIERAAA
jgi:hypothetical protein